MSPCKVQQRDNETSTITSSQVRRRHLFVGRPTPWVSAVAQELLQLQVTQGFVDCEGKIPDLHIDMDVINIFFHFVAIAAQWLHVITMA